MNGVVECKEVQSLQPIRFWYFLFAYARVDNLLTSSARAYYMTPPQLFRLMTQIRCLVIISQVHPLGNGYYGGIWGGTAIATHECCILFNICTRIDNPPGASVNIYKNIPAIPSCWPLFGDQLLDLKSAILWIMNDVVGYEDTTIATHGCCRLTGCM